MFSNHACCCLFQMFASNMQQNEWFQVRFFKNFLGRGSPSPLPRPLPPFFLGLRPRFGLRPQFSGASRLRIGLRPRFSGASRPRFGLRPQLSVENLVWPPQNKFLDPPLAQVSLRHERLRFCLTEAWTDMHGLEWTIKCIEKYFIFGNLDQSESFPVKFLQFYRI